MPPRLCFLRPCSIPVRAIPAKRVAGKLVPLHRRGYTSDAEKTPPEQPVGPNQDVLPHVSEEAAQTGNITGEGGPDLGQGTPVQEVHAPWSCHKFTLY